MAKTNFWIFEYTRKAKGIRNISRKIEIWMNFLEKIYQQKWKKKTLDEWHGSNSVTFINNKSVLPRTNHVQMFEWVGRKDTEGYRKHVIIFHFWFWDRLTTFWNEKRNNSPKIPENWRINQESRILKDNQIWSKFCQLIRWYYAKKFSC